MSSGRIDYRDTRLILLAVPLINTLNYYLTYDIIRWGQPYLYITFTLDIIEGYIGWWVTRSVIIAFDKRLPWETNMVRRIFVQLPIVIVVLVAVLAIQTELVNFIATEKPIPLKFYTRDIFIFVIWGVFLNFLYMGLYFWRKFQALEQEKSAIDHQDIVVKTGKTRKRIDLKEFKFFFVANDMVYGFIDSGKLPLPGFTLDKLEKQIDPSHFFRANRQTIITREVIDQIVAEMNGKLSVKLKKLDKSQSDLTISRLRAPAFRQWMEI
ncbi:MAG: LytTR family transcriptional regulator DNA-binding domain-containing protein [Cyclobacteriaceae bacterium]